MKVLIETTRLGLKVSGSEDLDNLRALRTDPGEFKTEALFYIVSFF